MIRNQKFHAHGKLLISAEYAVLYGASALAIPTARGQNLEVLYNSGESKVFKWTTKVLEEQVYESVFDHMGKCTESSNDEFSLTLEQIFRYILLKNGPDFFNNKLPLQFNSEIEFPLDWGLGSSSTLISNLASWAGLNPFDFQRSVFKGSGYDVACATSSSPIIYRLDKGQPIWEEVQFNPPFSDNLYFVHLNKKQNSRDAISGMKKQERLITDNLLEKVSGITNKMCQCLVKSEFADLMTEHEEIISAVLNTNTVKKEHFGDYPGAIKSLGAWGGDFIMVMGSEGEMQYFKKKGYNTVISFDKMVLALRA